MSILQTLRDGPRHQPGALRDILRSVWRIIRLMLGLLLVIETMISYTKGDIQVATLDAVLVLWLVNLNE